MAWNYILSNHDGHAILLWLTCELANWSELFLMLSKPSVCQKSYSTDRRGVISPTLSSLVAFRRLSLRQSLALPVPANLTLFRLAVLSEFTCDESRYSTVYLNTKLNESNTIDRVLMKIYEKWCHTSNSTRLYQRERK